MTVREYIEKTLAALSWKPPTVTPAEVTNRDEMPPFPIRLWVHLWAAAIVAVAVLMALIIGNPLARVRDPRLATQYDQQPLTALAARPGESHVWAGSQGGGIKVFDAGYHLFDRDLTRASTESALLSDFVQDVKFGPDGLAAIVVAESPTGAGGVQMAETGWSPRLWAKPCVDLTSFPGLDDTVASAVAESADGRWLIIGTRGQGLGVYGIAAHSWIQVVTRDDGLPSDRINDIATVQDPVGAEEIVFWVATDRGLCGGLVSAEGQFAPRWVLDRRTGLAGDDVVRLAVNADCLWYYTAGRGLGRIRLDAVGAPAGEGAHQALITECSLPGLTDSSFRLAAGSPVGPTTWFLSEIAGAAYIGRYREQPHDTNGTRMPDGFTKDRVTCLAADLSTGNAALLGTRTGAWFFSGTPSAGVGSEATCTDAVAGGEVGPAETAIAEAALMLPLAVIKVQGDRHTMLKRMKVETAETQWDWPTLVGDGRFPGLDSERNMTCIAAGAESRRLYFGTADKGIGVWDREAMEVRREFHSSHADDATKLRDNGSRDLAVGAAGELLQVTGDRAVDVFAEGQPRLGLVPPSAAPFPPTELVSVTASGPLFAAAGAGKIGIYDTGSFAWTELPPIPNVVRLEVTQSVLWALDRNGRLYSATLAAAERAWTTVLDNGVQNLAATPAQLHVIVQPDGGPAEMRTYDGQTGELAFAISPQALPAGDTRWRYAAAFEEGLYLIGTEACIHRYSLPERAWSSIPFPDTVSAPLAAVGQTAGAIWMTDARGALHQYQVAEGTFRTEVDTSVDRMSCGPASVLVHRKATTDSALRLVLHADAAGAESRTVLGSAYGGDLAATADALVYNNGLVVAQGNNVGFYNWPTHSWTTIKAPVDPVTEPVTELHTVGKALWAVAGRGDARTLLSWKEADSQFVPCTADGKALRVRKVTAAAAGLACLAADGRVLAIAAELPTEATELLGATRLGGAAAAPVTLRPETTALLGDDLVLADNQALHTYGPRPDIARWTATPFANDVIARLVSAPEEALIVAQGRANAWFIRKGDQGQVITTPVITGYAPQGGTADLKGVAVGGTEVACAVQVGSESGSRVLVRPSDGTGALRTAIGAALPTTGASPATTKAVIMPAAAGPLLRLDTGGALSSYDLQTHAWQVDTVPVRQVDELWHLGDRAVAYSRSEKTLLAWQNGTWQAEPNTRGQVTSVLPFAAGMLAWLDDLGTISLLTPGGECRAVRPLPSSKAAPGELGTLVAGAESDDLLALLGSTGRIALYDWRAQRWLGTLDGASQLVRVGAAGSIYALRGEAGNGSVVGPLRRAGQGGENGVAAPSISGAGAVRRLVATATGLFAFGEGQAIYRLDGTQLRRWWGTLPQAGSAARIPPGILAATETAGALTLALAAGDRGGDATPVAILRVQPSSLESSFAAAPYRFVRMLSVARGKALAVLADDDAAQFVGDLFGGDPLSVPAKDISAFALVGETVYGLRKGAVVQASAGREWRATGLSFAALPSAAPESLARPSMAALGEALLALLPTGRLYCYRDDGRGWRTVLPETDPRRFRALWLHGARLFAVSDQANTLALAEVECTPGNPVTLTDLPTDAGRPADNAPLAFGTLPPTRSAILRANREPASYQVTLVLKEGLADEHSQKYVLRNQRLFTAVTQVRAGRRPQELRVTPAAGDERVFDIGRDGELTERSREDAQGNEPEVPPPTVTETQTRESLVAVLRTQLGLAADDTGAACGTLGYAWGVQQQVLFRLDTATGEPQPMLAVGAPLPADESAATLGCTADGILVQTATGTLYRFTAPAGFAKLATTAPVRSLIQLDGKYFAVVANEAQAFSVLAFREDLSGLLAPTPRAWQGRGFGTAITGTGTAPAEPGPWQLPATLDGAFSYKGETLQFLEASGRMDAEVVTDLGASGDLLYCQSARGRSFFRQGNDGTWSRLDAAAARAVTEPAPVPLAGTYGAFTLESAPAGAWTDALGKGRIDIFRNAHDPHPRSRALSPSTRGTLLAHELVSDIASNGTAVCATTESGEVVLTTEANGAAHADLPQAKETRAAAPLLAAENWRLPTPTPTAAGGLVLERTFGERWSRVQLQASGFDFERVFTADIENGRLVFYTGAGRLLLPANGTTMVPEGLENVCQPPAGIEAGRYRLSRGLGDNPTVFLVPLDGAQGAERAWVRAENTWRRLSAAESTEFAELQRQPLLKNERWHWLRPVAGQAEQVVQTPEGGGKIESDFAEGRFGWDRCRSLGQSAGVIWIRTDAGLLSLTKGAVSLQSCIKSAANWSSCSFLDVSGAAPGALVDSAGTVTLAGSQSGSWKPAAELPRPALDEITTYRFTGTLWRVSRRGEVFRSRPQEPRVFDPVTLRENRWTFEQVNDLAVLAGVCYAATDGGLISLPSAPGAITGLWGNVGKADAFLVLDNQLIARISGGGVLQLQGKGWEKSAQAWPATPPPITVRGDRWVIVKNGTQVAYQAKRSVAAAVAAIAISRNDFAFDDVYDQSPTSAEQAVLDTFEGLYENSPDGDLDKVPVAQPKSERFAFSTLLLRPGVAVLHAKGEQGTWLKRDPAWAPLSPTDRETAAQAVARRAFSTRWRVTAATDGALAFELHLDADPPNTYKAVTFDSAQRLFGFDEFVCVAPAAGQRLLLGTAAGLQALGSAQELLRLWCVEKLDTSDSLRGTPARRIEAAVAGRDGRVYARAGDWYCAATTEEEKLQSTAPADFERAVAVRAVDPEGWNIDMPPATPTALRIRWRDQPVFLIAADGGRSRFAHNVVNAVATVGGSVVLGTAGGLVRLDSAQAEARSTFVLISDPFGPAAERGARTNPRAVDFLLGGREGGTVYARPEGATGRSVWRVEVATFQAPTPATLSEDEWQTLTQVHEDDILQWSTPQKGQIAIAFVPGKCVPATLKPQIRDQTFTFVDLDLAAGTAATTSTLAATDFGLFWLSKAGIIQYDPATGLLRRLYAAGADESRSLTSVTSLRWSAGERTLYARGSDGQFKYNAQDEAWEWIKGAAPLGDPDLIADTPLFTWRRSDRGVTVTLKNTDCPKLPCFDGKPLFDMVNDLAFAESEQGADGRVLLATQTGVASYAYESFAYQGLQAAAFTKDCRPPPPAVLQIAATATTAETSARVVCRTGDDRLFERADATWTPTTEADSVFDLSYRRVSRPDYWTWSRYPQGLTCTLLMVNGPPFIMGSAVRPELPAIFSRGKLAFDDAQRVFLTDDLQLLISTPAGIARYAIMLNEQTCTLSGWDVWATAAGSASPAPMSALHGLTFDGQSVVTWNSTLQYENAKPSERQWSRMDAGSTAVAAARTWHTGSGVWTTGAREAGGKAITATYSGAFTLKLCAPAEATQVVDIGHSGKALWCLTSSGLFKVSETRAKSYWRRWFHPSLLSGRSPQS